jgi:hypothetical protein
MAENKPDGNKPQPPQMKIEKSKLHEARIITNPLMREVIARVQSDGYEEAVEKLLDITDEGLILGLRMINDLSYTREWVAAMTLMIDQLSFRGLIDNQAIMGLRVAVRAAAGGVPGGVPPRTYGGQGGGEGAGGRIVTP